MPAAKKSEPQLVEKTISHSAGGGVKIRKYGDESSTYSYFESSKYTFGEDWTEEEVNDFIEEKRRELRVRVDDIATDEHAERFDASYMAGD